jgi:polyphosphate glucokinase
MSEQIVLGIDVGGSGIKGALIDIQTGELVSERIRLETPQPSTPQAMGETFAELAARFNWKGYIGCGFPAIIRNGVALSASNIHSSWLNCQVDNVFSDITGCRVHLINDADAAGLAAMHFGLGRGEMGTVLLITIGTGIGSALFHKGVLMPNTEFGHIYLQGHQEVAERYCADSARKREGLEWETWGRRLNEYLHFVDRLVLPDLIILGGGASKHYEKYAHCLTLNTRVKAAILQNNGGMIGAAWNAWNLEQQ